MLPIYGDFKFNLQLASLPPVPGNYHLSKWKDHGPYWEYTAPQHDESGKANLDWLAVKTGRVSGTGSGYVLGHGFEKDKSFPELALELAGIKKKIFSEQQLKNMQHGTDNEDRARKMYESKNNVTANELGFVVPKWNLNIGISPDGCVDKSDQNGVYGIIEIKCPQRMYRPYLEYMEQDNPNPNDYSHIWKSHFDQMQWGMGIMGRGWADYVVVDTFQELYFQQRVLFQQQYFNEMYSKIVNFHNTYLAPLLLSSPYPLMPPK